MKRHGFRNFSSYFSITIFKKWKKNHLHKSCFFIRWLPFEFTFEKKRFKNHKNFALTRRVQFWKPRPQLSVTKPKKAFKLRKWWNMKTFQKNFFSSKSSSGYVEGSLKNYDNAKSQQIWKNAEILNNVKLKHDITWIQYVHILTT